MQTLHQPTAQTATATNQTPKHRRSTIVASIVSQPAERVYSVAEDKPFTPCMECACMGTCAKSGHCLLCKEHNDGVNPGSYAVVAPVSPAPVLPLRGRKSCEVTGDLFAPREPAASLKAKFDDLLALQRDGGCAEYAHAAPDEDEVEDAYNSWRCAEAVEEREAYERGDFDSDSITPEEQEAIRFLEASWQGEDY